MPSRKILILFSAGFPLLTGPEHLPELAATIDACNESCVTIFPSTSAGWQLLLQTAAILAPRTRFQQQLKPALSMNKLSETAPDSYRPVSRSLSPIHKNLAARVALRVAVTAANLVAAQVEGEASRVEEAVLREEATRAVTAIQADLLRLRTTPTTISTAYPGINRAILSRY